MPGQSVFWRVRGWRADTGGLHIRESRTPALPGVPAVSHSDRRQSQELTPSQLRECATLLTEETIGLPTFGTAFRVIFPEDQDVLAPGSKERWAVALTVMTAAEARAHLSRLPRADAGGIDRLISQADYFILAAKCTAGGIVDGKVRTENDGRLHVHDGAGMAAAGFKRPTTIELSKLRLVPFGGTRFYSRPGQDPVTGHLAKADMLRVFDRLKEISPTLARSLQERTLTTDRFGSPDTFVLNHRLRHGLSERARGSLSRNTMRGRKTAPSPAGERDGRRAQLRVVAGGRQR